MHNSAMLILLYLFVTTLFSGLSYAHASTTKAICTDTPVIAAGNPPTVKIQKQPRLPDTSHKPALAFMRSGIIPGWGQLYNEKWWKVPVIYTGLGLLGSAIIYNRRYYIQCLTIYRYYQQDPATVNNNLPHYAQYKKLRNRGVNQPAVASYLNSYQRNMQLSVLGLAGAWGIQMLDAYIDAKFIQSYSIDRKLSINISPAVINYTSLHAYSPQSAMVPALQLTANF
jgi:hypothetical protein